MGKAGHCWVQGDGLSRGSGRDLARTHTESLGSRTGPELLGKKQGEQGEGSPVPPGKGSTIQGTSPAPSTKELPALRLGGDAADLPPFPSVGRSADCPRDGLEHQEDKAHQPVSVSDSAPSINISSTILSSLEHSGVCTEEPQNGSTCHPHTGYLCPVQA